MILEYLNNIFQLINSRSNTKRTIEQERKIEMQSINNIGNREWNQKEIDVFTRIINTQQDMSLQKKFCMIVTQNPHKRMVDVWVFFQFYRNHCPSLLDAHEIQSSWETFRKNEKNMSKLSHQLKDFKNYELQHTFTIGRISQDSRTFNDIVQTAISDKKKHCLFEINRIDNLLENQTELNQNQVNELINLKKKYEFIVSQQPSSMLQKV